jgi:uncharacterized protein (TIGR02600 family)
MFMQISEQRKPKKGIALILTLAALVLISVLVLAVLTSVGTFTQSTRAGSNNSSTRALADDVVQLVTAQIRDATTQDQTISWASQPGMIRTYDTTGNPKLYYKLYSAPSMVIAGNGFSLGALVEQDVASDWDTKPGLFTDLNSPVIASDGLTQVFPIVDPRAWSGVANAPPIPNSGWNISTDVQGFTYSTSPPSGGSAIDGVSLPNSGNPRLPMPAQWLYVRKSGYITAPSGGSGASIQVPANPNPPNNLPDPIVGRIAFWTDDDTCKININTACGDLWSPDTFPGNEPGPSNPSLGTNLSTPGSYWEVPRASTWYDQWVIGPIIPLVHEFQRYAGHPATVYLSAVFPQFSAINGQAGNARDQLYSIIPRVNGGTGNPGDGTAGASGQNTEGGSIFPTAATNGQYVIAPKHDRLYASIDELLYDPERSTNPYQGNGAAVITPTELEKAKFFITAHSSAPELNLFNLPRISMWPIDSSYNKSSVSPRCTAYDQLLAYCCSLNESASTPFYYFFQRSNPQSITQDWDNIQRNQDIYSYLNYLMGQPFPGYGGKLGSKYNATYNNVAESDQILTEIMDYIRCINLQDPLIPVAFNQFSGDVGSLKGMVIPLQPDSGPAKYTMGFGRYLTIGGVGLQFAVIQDPAPTMPYSASNPPSEQVRAVLLLKGEAVSSILPFLQISGFGVKLVSSQTLTVTDSQGTAHTVTFPGGALSYANTLLQPGATDSTVSPYPNNSSLIVPDFVTGAGGPAAYATVMASAPFSMPAPPYAISNGAVTYSPTAAEPFALAVSGSATEFDIYYQGTLIQKISVDLSKLTGNWATPYYPSGSTRTTNPSIFPDTIANGDSVKTLVPGYPQFTTGDVHAGGDYRLIAGSINPPVNYWVAEGLGDPNTSHNPGQATNPTSYYNSVPAAPNTGIPLCAQNFTNDQIATSSYPSKFPGYSMGSLINVAVNTSGLGSLGDYTFGWGDTPKSPQSYSATLTGGTAIPFRTEVTHDFDQGAGQSADGAFINHPEEVSVNNLASSDRSPYFGNIFFLSSSSGTSGKSTALGVNTSGNASTATFSTPNRLVPSPVILGSLPSAIIYSENAANSKQTPLPWQTLLFRAQPEHPGSGGYNGPVGGYAYGTSANMKSPPYTVMPDHLFLDLFWMPVVEPYAISDVFSTSGKINMNYQIMPFTYIDRATAMEAVLRSQRMAAIPTNENIFHKAQYPQNGITGANDPRFDFRHDINLSPSNGGTLMQFETKFDSGDIFRSASQICDIYLVPLPNAAFPNLPANGFGTRDNPASVDTAAYQWWNKTTLTSNSNTTDTNVANSLFGSLSGFKLTGDNLREEPYANIYSLLTTKSNSYTVHMRVQSLKQTGHDLTTWSDPASGGSGLITGEYRGSASIERYIDPSDPNLSSDFATMALSNTSVSMSSLYKYRVTSTKQFAP